MSPPVVLCIVTMSPPIHCCILCSCSADEGTRQPTITWRRLGRHICVLLLSSDNCSIPLRFGFVMLWPLFCFLICFTMILYGCDFTVLGPVVTGQSARSSHCCYWAACLTPQTNVTENERRHRPSEPGRDQSRATTK